MAVKLTTIQDLHNYFSGVVQRATHHAPNVDEIIYILLGMIIAYKDSGTDINVSGQKSGTGNLLWVHIKGTHYAFQYDHLSASIKIHKNSYRGTLINTINNKTTLQQLCNIFNNL